MAILRPARRRDCRCLRCDFRPPPAARVRRLAWARSSARRCQDRPRAEWARAGGSASLDIARLRRGKEGQRAARREGGERSGAFVQRRALRRADTQPVLAITGARLVGGSGWSVWFGLGYRPATANEALHSPRLNS